MLEQTYHITPAYLPPQYVRRKVKKTLLLPSLWETHLQGKPWNLRSSILAIPWRPEIMAGIYATETGLGWWGPRLAGIKYLVTKDKIGMVIIMDLWKNVAMVGGMKLPMGLVT